MATVLAPTEIMRDIFSDALPAYADSPQLFCDRRRGLALVCRSWAAVVYGDTSMWSTITVARRTSLRAMRLAIVLSRERGLAVKLSFESLSADFPSVLALATVHRIQEVFSIIRPASSRWRSFVFSCQHPAIFSCVNAHCSDICAPSLISVSLLYWYLPGYGQVTSDYSFLDPFTPRVWFNGILPSLARVELNSVPVLWYSPRLFDNLETLDLSDFPSMAPIRWQVFEALFAAARRLRVLRIANIRIDGTLPEHRLSSQSVELLDVRFVGCSVLGFLLQKTDFPNIRTFVARGFYQVDLDATLLWATLDLLSNWPPTVSMVSGLLVSSTLTSMENLTFSCYSSGTSNAGTSGTAPLESLFADGQFPNLRQLSVSGVQLKWTGKYGFPSLTRLSLRTIPRASWPTFGQLNALFKVAPRIQTLSLLGVGCTSASLASPPIPVASLLNLEVAFGTGSPSDAIHLYNIVRGFSFPNLAQLVVAFHVLPSLHAFASSSVVAGCCSIRLAGRICCDFWLGQLFHSMKEVVTISISGLALLEAGDIGGADRAASTLDPKGQRFTVLLLGEGVPKFMPFPDLRVA
ncbi:hypothetical protein C8R46DRAFT_1218384 [Mycena filopes]|nr:hypothetical protein C8R46DRAFT_1218384 [Mycena filopes]